MNERTRLSRRVVAAALGTAVLAGCGAPHPGAATVHTPAVDDHDHEAAPDRPTAPDAPSPAPPPTGPTANYGDPTKVCRAFTAALYSADTTRDRGPMDAYLRATRFMDGALTAQSAAAQSDGRWDTWRSHGVTLDTHVSAHADVHQDPDSTVTAYRVQKVRTTPVGDDGWRGWTDTSLISCTLRHTDAGWRVSDYAVDPVDGHE